MHKKSSLISIIVCVLLIISMFAPMSFAASDNGNGNKPGTSIPTGSDKLCTYDSVTSGGNCLRAFALLGFVDNNKMNRISVSATADVYYVANPVNHTFKYAGKLTSKNDLVGSFVELWDTNKDKNADLILSVPRSLSKVYWDSNMHWLPGVGETSDPTVTDARGEAAFGKEYVIPMGERQLEGYGLGDWSGTDDFSNLEDETYWPFINYYHASSSKTLTMLTGYKTNQQATGGTCGPSSALTVLDWYGLRADLNEKDLSALRNPEDANNWCGYTSLKSMIDIFKNLEKLNITKDWNLYSSYDNPNALFDSQWVLDTLAKGCPILVGWQAFGGHWQVIIGYDNMGTENTNDDVLIMMDPYDSTDHMNDGYTVQSYERLAYGVGLKENVGTNGEPFYGTNFLVATPAKWKYKPVMGEGIPDITTNIADFSDSHKIPYGDAAKDLDDLYPSTPYRGLGGAGLAGAATEGYERSGDYNNSPYYKFFDFYDMESSDSLILLENYQTTQQVTEWTCGPSSTLTVVNWFGEKEPGMTELDLAQLRQGGKPGATKVDGMAEIFAGLNENYGQDWEWFTTQDLTYDSDMDASEIGGYYLEWGAEDGGLIPELLKKGIPMMIGWDEWGGHWQVIIGYDDMGTPQTQDDVLILADPYDTTDHNQDGYTIESFERLVYGWTAKFDEKYPEFAFVVAYPAEDDPGFVN